MKIYYHSICLHSSLRVFCVYTAKNKLLKDFWEFSGAFCSNHNNNKSLFPIIQKQIQRYVRINGTKVQKIKRELS